MCLCCADMLGNIFCVSKNTVSFFVLWGIVARLPLKTFFPILLSLHLFTLSFCDFLFRRHESCQWLSLSVWLLIFLSCIFVSLSVCQLSSSSCLSFSLFLCFHYSRTSPHRSHWDWRFLTFKERWNHIKNYHLGPKNVDLYWWGTFKSEAVFAGFHYTQHKKLIRKDLILKKMIKENH